MIPTGQDTEEGTGLLPGAATNDRDSTRQRTETEEAPQGTGGDPERENSTFKDGELPKCVTLPGTFRQGCAGKKKISYFGAFASSCGVSTPTMAKFKLPV